VALSPGRTLESHHAEVGGDHRSTGLDTSMSQYLIDRIASLPNIAVMPQVEVREARGNDHLEEIVIRHLDNGVEEALACAALFLFVSANPRTESFSGFVERDDRGFILTGADLPRNGSRPRHWNVDRDPYLFETSVPGVFAAGDVRAGANRRVAAAVGEGSAAIYSIQRYLETV
jgi:thioredoxin reductase (NADPH)